MMKHSHFSSLFNTLCSRLSLLNATAHFSTAAPKPHRKFWNGSVNDLYRRISRTHPAASALPILDQWVQDGGSVDKHALVSIVKELRHHKDYSHALEVSMWMSDKRYIRLSHSDVADRLDLIAKVHGTEQAENYFNNTPNELKVLKVYSVLLNCYCHAKQLEKAEATMQKIRDLGFSQTSPYNVLLNLYYKTGLKEKFNSLTSEMEENGIECDNFTYGIKLSAAAAFSDLEGVDKILAEWESNSNIREDWTKYAIAADGYTKAGAFDKALAMLKKSEELIPKYERPREAYEHLMSQYAVLGKKDDVVRIWELYKRRLKVYNKGYKIMITSLLKIGDSESAEKIFDEWESQQSRYDVRIPNHLIADYSRKGLPDKAEAILERVLRKGGKPDAKSWWCLAKAHLDHDQIEKAVEFSRKSLLVVNAGWKTAKDVWASCLNYLITKPDPDTAKEYIRLLHDKMVITTKTQERLLNKMNEADSNPVTAGELECDVPKGDEEEVKLQQWRGVLASRFKCR